MNVNRTVGSPLGQPALPAGDRHGGRLHPVAPGNSDPLGLHGITSLPLGTASASFRKPPGGVDASPRTGAPPLPRRVRPAGTGPPGTVRSLLRERLGPCGRSAFASVRSTAGLALCAVAVLIPVPNALDLRLRIRPLPARPYVRVRTGEAAVGAAEGRSDLKPDGVSERDRDRLAVRHHVHGDVVPPDPSADSLQEGGPAVAAASEPDSLQVTFSQGLHVASHLSPPR